MLIRKTAIVFAAAVALGFLTPVPDAPSMKECSGRYHTPAKANTRIQCGANASNVFSRRPPRGITLGIGDVVSVTIFEAEAGGLFLPSEAGARPGNFVTLPDQMVDFRRQHNGAVRWHDPSRRADAVGGSTGDH